MFALPLRKNAKLLQKKHKRCLYLLRYLLFVKKTTAQRLENEWRKVRADQDYEVARFIQIVGEYLESGEKHKTLKA